jgi:hypothetical protein
MGSETTSLSVPKDHTNPTYDPDEDGAVDNVNQSLLAASASDASVTTYYQTQTTAGSYPITLANVTASGVLVGGIFGSGSTGDAVDVTADGGQTLTFTADPIAHDTVCLVPPVRFEDSLEVVLPGRDNVQQEGYIMVRDDA